MQIGQNTKLIRSFFFDTAYPKAKLKGMKKNPETTKHFGIYMTALYSLLGRAKRLLRSRANHDLELRSSSFSLGNENKLSFHSLNHDLFTITNVEALSWVIHTLALEVVIHFV